MNTSLMMPMTIHVPIHVTVAVPIHVTVDAQGDASALTPGYKWG